jgi:DHA3 family macrolide efflux protein-like MFS transporter
MMPAVDVEESAPPVEAIEKPASGLLGALQTRDFALLFSGQLASEFGNGLVQLALPWLVLQLTGSAFQLGLAYFIQFLPILVFGLVGGVFVDRWDRRLTIVIVDSIRFVGFLSVGVIYYLGALTAAHLYIVIFLEAALANFFNPARAALVPNLVDEDHLRSANSLMEVSRYLGVFIAPTVGAYLTAQFGGAALMLIDGVSFGISAVTVFAMMYRQPVSEAGVSLGFVQALGGVLDETKAGLQKIMETHLLKVAIILGFSLNLIIAPIQLLLPLFVQNVKHAGADYFGLLVAGLLLGSIAGALAAPASARRFGLGRVTIVSVLILGAVVTVASLPPMMWPPLLAMAVAGTCLGTLNVAQTTLIQGSTTDEERGRVSATYYTSTLGVRPFAFLIMGILASAVDIRLLFVFLGCMAVMLAFLLNRSSEVRETR